MEKITDISQLDPDGTYTYADYLQWKIDEYVELFRGKIRRMSPAPLRQHQWIAGNIFREISNELKRKPCKIYIAPFDVRLPKKEGIEDGKIYTVVQPDVCIICDPAKLDYRGCVGAPDTIIEILSKKNMDRDVREKFALYEEHGVKEYWIVNPGVRNLVTYLLNTNGKYELSGDYGDEGDQIPVASISGFSLSWDEIFEE